MIRLKNKILLSLISAFLFPSCVNNSEEELYPDCSTDNITYSTHIHPYIQNNCTSCHNDNNAGGGISYSNFSGIKNSVDDGGFLGSIKHEDGFSAMPPNEPITDDCKIQQIEAWIQEGAQNN